MEDVLDKHLLDAIFVRKAEAADTMEKKIKFCQSFLSKYGNVGYDDHDERLKEDFFRRFGMVKPITASIALSSTDMMYRMKTEDVMDSVREMLSHEIAHTLSDIMTVETTFDVSNASYRYRGTALILIPNEATKGPRT